MSENPYENSNYLQAESLTLWNRIDPFILKQISSNETFKILEFGCGEGRIINLLTKNNTPIENIFGLGLKDDAINQCKKRWPQNVDNFTNPSKIDTSWLNSFDILISVGVIPHFSNEDTLTNYLLKARDFLKKNGQIILIGISQNSCGKFDEMEVKPQVDSSENLNKVLVETRLNIGKKIITFDDYAWNNQYLKLLLLKLNFVEIDIQTNKPFVFITCKKS